MNLLWTSESVLQMIGLKMNHFNRVFNNAPMPDVIALAEHSILPAAPLSFLAVCQALWPSRLAEL